jgi:hypothetical protein
MKSSNQVNSEQLGAIENKKNSSEQVKISSSDTLTSKEKDNAIIDVLIKSVPDILALDTTFDRDTIKDSLKLHIYAVRTFCSTPSSEARVHTCHSCQAHLKVSLISSDIYNHNKSILGNEFSRISSAKTSPSRNFRCCWERYTSFS